MHKSYRFFLVLPILFCTIFQIKEISAKKVSTKKVKKHSKKDSKKVRRLKKKKLKKKKKKTKKKKVKRSALKRINFADKFKSSIAIVKRVLEAAKGGLLRLGQEINTASYAESTKIKIVKEDSLTGRPMGFEIDLMQAGAGSVGTGLTGVIIEPVLEPVPISFKPLFRTIINKTLARAIGGSMQKHPWIEGQEVLMSSSELEFFLRMALLAKEKAKDTVSMQQFATELMLLVFRLSQTKGFRTPDEIFNKIPKPLQVVFSKIVIKKKSLKNFLQGYWGDFQNIVNYDFTKKDESELKAKDFPKVIKGMAAIFFRAVIDYSKAKEAYLETFVDQEARVSETPEFRSRIPGYENIKIQLKERINDLLMRFKLYIKIKDKFLSKIKPLADTLLSSIGLSLDGLLLDDTKYGFSDEELSVAEIDAMMAEGEMLGVDIERGFVEAAKAVEVATVDELHSIDWINSLLDTFDELDEKGELDEEKSINLEDELMTAADKGFKDFEVYDNQEKEEFGYALINILGWVQDEGYVDDLKNYLTSVNVSLKEKGIGLKGVKKILVDEEQEEEKDEKELELEAKIEPVKKKKIVSKVKKEFIKEEPKKEPIVVVEKLAKEVEQLGSLITKYNKLFDDEGRELSDDDEDILMDAVDAVFKNFDKYEKKNKESFGAFVVDLLYIIKYEEYLDELSDRLNIFLEQGIVIKGAKEVLDDLVKEEKEDLEKIKIETKKELVKKKKIVSKVKKEFIKEKPIEKPIEKMAEEVGQLGSLITKYNKLFDDEGRELSDDDEDVLMDAVDAVLKKIDKYEQKDKESFGAFIIDLLYIIKYEEYLDELSDSLNTFLEQGIVIEGAKEVLDDLAKEEEEIEDSKEKESEEEY